ncbi:uncharacterized protein LOC133837416 [Drosophila sulfurigaster albostrigata]|uniref:uncharacterized protein LOC133837416 n=1 Tax=Drosophila sulfurigaster albostrigata TaxID=89887 RepID=UPI002D2193EF|nr:uncharacterized protein LOC133837416 [Drosophila sulfurigaster albostrigata]
MMPEVNKISVLRKMFGFDKKKTANSYIVPQNSAAKLEQKSTSNNNNKDPLKEQVENLKENHYERSNMNKCPHCENMAKNFLYLESLIRNNCDKNQKCSLCQSSLKYLQYVNRNIMQVFGNFDSIVQAARVFASQSPPTPKYAVKKPQIQEPQQQQQGVRAQGGALLPAQKSAKLLKAVKSQKSKKSMKSSKSAKSVSKSNKNMNKNKKSKIASKSRVHIAGRGKMVLKSKYKSKAAGKSGKLSRQISKVVRSASQYQNLHSSKSKKLKTKQRVHPQPTSINWNLLKRNMPKRMKALGVN